MALLACAAGWAQPADYVIQPAAGASFVLEVHKTGLMSGKKHVFRFERYEGGLRYDPAHPETSHVRLSIEAASAVCEDDWVSESQRADILKYALNDMMAVAEHPRLVFESSGVRPGAGGKFSVTGTLTIRGKAKPVTLEVALGNKGDSLRFDGAAVVNLKHYGIKPRRAFLGVIGTKNEMDVRFRLIATKR